MGSAGNCPRVVHRRDEGIDSRLRGNDGLKARAETDWYAACSDETHQRWIGEGGHLFQVQALDFSVVVITIMVCSSLRRGCGGRER